MPTITVVIDELGDFIDEVLKQVAIRTVENLTRSPAEGGTPIKTGHASSRWIPYIGSVPTALEPRVRGVRIASRSDQEAALAALESYKSDQGKITVTNLAPYIGLLNDGSSAQAPRGFVQRNIAEAVNSI